MQLRLAKAGMASWSEAERAPATFQLMILEAIE
jgi:hypothetical protein